MKKLLTPDGYFDKKVYSEISGFKIFAFLATVTL